MHEMEMEEFDEWPCLPFIGTYYIECSGGKDGGVFRVEEICFDDREVALTEIATGKEVYTFLDNFDEYYEEIEDRELPLYLLANVGVDNG